MPNCRQNAVIDGSADDDSREAETNKLVDAGVVEAQVDDEHAVHPVFAEPAAVDLDLVADVADELERECDGARRELLLDPGDELHEERLVRDRPRGPCEHEPARVGAGRRERARRTIRIPAELVRDRDDAIARVVGDARPAVECVRDGALGHTGALGDVLDRDPTAPLLHHAPASFDGTLSAVVCS